MNAMTKAHQIRKAAAEKFNCKVSEIHFGECLRMAHNYKEIDMRAAENGASKSYSEWAVDYHMVGARNEKGSSVTPNGPGTWWMIPKEEKITLKKCQQMAHDIGATYLDIDKTDGQNVRYDARKNMMLIFKGEKLVYKNEDGVIYAERDIS